MRTLKVSAAVLAAGLVFGACGTPAPEADEPAAQPTAAEESEAEPEPEETLESGASREDPYLPGDTFAFGAWELTLGETDTDATQKIIDAQLEAYGGDESYTTPPDEGHVYITVPVTATFTGEDRDDPGFALTFTYVTADGNTYGDILAVSAPNDLTEVGELYNGATAEGNVLQMVPEDAAEGGTWRITEDSMDATAGEVYVAASDG